MNATRSFPSDLVKKAKLNLLVVFHTSILQHLKSFGRPYTARTPPALLRAGHGPLAGDIRQGGGSFGKMEKAKEDEYFYKKTKTDIEKMHNTKEAQLKSVQEHIKKHEGDVRHYEQILKELENDIKRSK